MSFKCAPSLLRPHSFTIASLTCIVLYWLKTKCTGVSCTLGAIVVGGGRRCSDPTRDISLASRRPPRRRCAKRLNVAQNLSRMRTEIPALLDGSKCRNAADQWRNLDEQSISQQSEATAKTSKIKANVILLPRHRGNRSPHNRYSPHQVYRLNFYSTTLVRMRPYLTVTPSTICTLMIMCAVQ